METQKEKDLTKALEQAILFIETYNKYWDEGEKYAKDVVKFLTIAAFIVGISIGVPLGIILYKFVF